jgi:hypothetical protein
MGFSGPSRFRWQSPFYRSIVLLNWDRIGVKWANTAQSPFTSDTVVCDLKDTVNALSHPHRSLLSLAWLVIGATIGVLFDMDERS